jgi:NADH:ubiquinone oxidoreductase subunit 5 (subunit L)/multisubunit Na+/H+ antiporter MnhA subunit
MNHFIHLLVGIPIFSFLLSLLINENNEKAIGRLAYFSSLIHFVLTTATVVRWLLMPESTYNLHDLSIYHNHEYDFYIDFLVDRTSLTFTWVGSFITFMVITYSRRYMHKEFGFKRYFNTILLFYVGYTTIALSGNFETLFIGWEFLGISSFLLISFYRYRYLPVRNSVKVYSIYRIGDIGILLTMWMSHHLWHRNISFSEIQDWGWVHDQLTMHPSKVLFISLMIILAAIAKSAQYPFTGWLPRAMEGPTPSSAIFYGALSIHMGCFLLLRTDHIWGTNLGARWVIGIIGGVTAIISHLITKTQSTLKGQIAYSSATQIGIMFIEIALGLESIALFHFAGNAFLRSYQLLTSPSLMALKIREQTFEPAQGEQTSSASTWMRKFKSTVYLMGLKEWNLDHLIFLLIFRPLKWIGKPFKRFSLLQLFLVTLPIYCLGLMMIPNGDHETHGIYHQLGSLIVGILAVVFISRAYTEKGNAIHAWIFVIGTHFLIDLAVSMNQPLNAKETTIYLSGVLTSGIVGLAILFFMQRKNQLLTLFDYQGMAAKYPTLSTLFLITALGISGFPISTSFFGEDLIFVHIHQDQYALATITALVFVINGITVIRLYAKLFLGTHPRNIQEKSELTY